MRYLLFLLTVVSATSLFGAPNLPFRNVEAEHVDFDEKILHLVGNVRVDHDFGIMSCRESTVLLRQEKKEGETVPLDHIFLKGDVCIDFTDGSQLRCDEGTIDCGSLDGTFISNDPGKVVYTTFVSNGSTRIPVKATSKALHATIVKTSEGYALKKLQGEGAVNIAYDQTADQNSSIGLKGSRAEQEPQHEAEQ